MSRFGATLCLFLLAMLGASAQAPTPPFKQCPKVGSSNSCGVLIVINANNTVSIYTDSSVPPYEDSEDTLVGFQNNSTKTITSLPLKGNTDIFGFEDDGICATSINPRPAGCPFGPTLYEGPGVSYTNISADKSSGTVNFSPGIPPGGSAYFGLEETLTASQVSVPLNTSCPTATATSGVAYSSQLVGSGGTGVFTWTLSAGSLAPLTLSSSGLVSGTPAAAGTLSFTLKITDTASATATQACSIVVSASSSTATVVAVQLSKTDSNANCAIPQAVSSFKTTDIEIWTYISVSNLAKNDVFRIDWVNPSGTIVFADAYDPLQAAGNYCFSDYLSTAGDSYTPVAGTWTIKYYVNGKLLTSLPMPITAATSTLSITKVQLSKTVSPSACVAPVAVTSFKTTDTEIWAYLQVANAQTNDALRVDWIDPNGKTARTINFTPVSGPGTWCFDAWLTKAGDPVTPVVGTYTVRFNWNTSLLTTLSAPITAGTIGDCTSSFVGQWSTNLFGGGLAIPSPGPDGFFNGTAITDGFVFGRVFTSYGAGSMNRFLISTDGKSMIMLPEFGNQPGGGTRVVATTPAVPCPSINTSALWVGQWNTSLGYVWGRINPDGTNTLIVQSDCSTFPGGVLTGLSVGTTLAGTYVGFDGSAGTFSITMGSSDIGVFGGSITPAGKAAIPFSAKIVKLGYEVSGVGFTGFNGRWSTNAGLVTLKQTGTSIAGTYGVGGTITGTVTNPNNSQLGPPNFGTGLTLTGTYSDSTGSGSITLVLDGVGTPSQGQTFHGNVGGAPIVGGKSGSLLGTWNTSIGSMNIAQTGSGQWVGAAGDFIFAGNTPFVPDTGPTWGAHFNGPFGDGSMVLTADTTGQAFSVTPTSDGFYNGVSASILGTFGSDTLVPFDMCKVINPVITVTTNPPGLTVQVDNGSNQKAPLALNWASYSGHRVSVSDTPQTVGNTTYAFAKWNDARNSNHPVTPIGTVAYTAYFRSTTNGVTTLPLFSTGMESEGGLTPVGFADDNYPLFTSPDQAWPSPVAFVLSPPSTWLPNTATSQWIAPRPDFAKGNVAGSYTYELNRIDLSTVDPATTVITGRFATSGSASILLNGTTVSSTPANNPGVWTNFTINNNGAGKFLTGGNSVFNTLDFVVQNSTGGPAALRVEIFSATATSIGGSTGGGGACAPTATNLLGNGSFEQPGGASVLTVGGAAIPCWTVTSGNIDYIRAADYWTAQDGSYSLDMDGLTPATIAQTFATTAGTAYTVSYYIAGNTGGGPTLKTMQVSAAGQTATKTFDITGKTYTNMGWTLSTFQFTANSASTTLQFTSLDAAGNIYGPALDNVCVIAGSTPCSGQSTGGIGGFGGTWTTTIGTNTGSIGITVNGNTATGTYSGGTFTCQITGDVCTGTFTYQGGTGTLVLTLTSPGNMTAAFTYPVTGTRNGSGSGFGGNWTLNFGGITQPLTIAVNGNTASGTFGGGSFTCTISGNTCTGTFTFDTLTGTIVINLNGNSFTASVTILVPATQGSSGAPVTSTCAGTCTLATPAQPAPAPTNGGTGSVGVTSTSTWSAVPLSPWISINSGGSGNGNGTVNYTVAPNTGPSRVGTISIAGQNYTVFQNGTPTGTTAGCNYLIQSNTTQNVSPNGGNGLIQIVTAQNCSWTSSVTSSWITLNTALSSTGNGAVSYTATPNNTGFARTGAIIVAGQNVVVMQSPQTLVSGAPSIASGGIANAASYALGGPPNGLAQGSFISIFGTNLGPDQFLKASTYPLPTNLGGVNVQVIVGPYTYDAYLIFVSATQINAILPSNTLLGTGRVVVTYNGKTGPSATILVSKTSFGVFYQVVGGQNLAIAQNVKTATDYPLNLPSSPAKPGQIVILWGTGLGAVSGGDNVAPGNGDMTGVTVNITVGGLPATRLYAGRQAESAAVDNIYFTVPQGVALGCNIPVSITAGGVPANDTVIAISSDGSPCK